MLKGELIIAVDFDGTITTNPDMGGELILQEHCKEVLMRLYDDGVTLVLWTCRSGIALKQALDFLSQQGLFHIFVSVNEQVPEVYDKYYPEVAKKVGADIYIDDKNLGTVIDWYDIENKLYGGM